MKLVFISGPYRSSTAWGIEQNIYRAKEAGAKVALLGGFPVIPHANTAHFDGIATDEFWLEGTIELLRRCDAVFMLPDWPNSVGAVLEKTEAEKLGLPIFADFKVLRQWLTNKCTGISANWCPVHGDCTCAYINGDENQGRTLDDENCPLHGFRSNHGENN